MNDDRESPVAQATALFDERCTMEAVAAAEQSGWSADLWRELEQRGLTLVGVPRGSGGAGGTLGDGAAILRASGRYAAPVPLAETGFLAGWALSASGLPVPEGPLAVAPVRAGERIQFRRDGGSWSLSGHARRMPAARIATRLMVVGRTGDEVAVALVDPDACEITPGKNLAGEPRDDVALDGVRVAGDEVALAGRDVDEEALRLRGALARSILMSGALECVLELSVCHVRERHQFGRTIGQFQAIQQQLASLAGEVAAASAATDAAVAAAELGRATFEIAAAKIRVGEAAGTAAAIAHQVHGAIGFTERHPLRHSTRRLWAWREEFGPESEWAARLGGIIAEGGPEGLWPTLTTPPPVIE